jgi:nucleoid DNA-binding protein
LSLGKKYIIHNIFSETSINKTTSKEFLESFLYVIKTNKLRQIQIPNFGLFYLHKSPERIGRNPRTKKDFKIPNRRTLKFKSSNTVKKNLN